MKSVKLTSNMLKRLIEEEAAKFGPMKDVEDVAAEVEETDADEYADSLAKQIDYVKALKIEEARLTKRIQKIREARSLAVKKITGRLV